MTNSYKNSQSINLRKLLFIIGISICLASKTFASTENTLQIRFENEVTLDSLKKARLDLSFERIIPYSKQHDERHRKSGINLWYTVKTKQPAIIDTIINSLSGIEGIRSINRPQKIQTPGFINEPMVVSNEPMLQPKSAQQTNDPLYPKQWHYSNTEYANINLDAAWQLETGSPDVIVAVMDMWVDHEHPDLRNNMWTNQIELNGQPGIDDDNNGYIDDIHGLNLLTTYNEPGDHGTHVAGTIAAVNNNGIGVCGIAGGNGNSSTGVRIMSCALINSHEKGFIDADVAKNFVYAADNGAVISQNSWKNEEASDLVAEAINYFIEYAGDYEGSPMKGGLVIFAAGNYNSNEILNPMNKPIITKDNLIIVASVNSYRDKASYSNYGDWVDISAPGGDYNILDGGGVLSTITNGRYAYKSGTSMACPHVSGIAALIVSKFKGTNLTGADVKKRILNATTDINNYIKGKHYENLMGIGIADAYQALLENPNVAPNNIKDLSIINLANDTSIVSWIIPSDGNNVATKQCVLYPCDDFGNIEYPGIIFDTQGLTPNKTITKTISGISSYKNFRMQAYDVWGNGSSLSEIVTPNIITDTPFLINPYSKEAFIVYQNNKSYDMQSSDVSLAFPIISSDNTSVEYKIEDEGNCITNTTFDGKILAFDICPSSETPEGYYPFKITITETKASNGTYCIDSLSYQVRKALIYDIPVPMLREGKETTLYTSKESGEFKFCIKDYIEDPLGLDLTFSSDTDLEYDDFQHEVHSSIINEDTLHVSYRYNMDFIIWNNYDIQFTVSATNSYSVSNYIKFTIMYDETNNIENICIDNNYQNSGIYTLTGSKIDIPIENLSPGFYIINGKKTFIKPK